VRARTVSDASTVQEVTPVQQERGQ
jgi:hypothetical protein